MSWRERLGFVGRVLTWRARINRVQFGVFFTATWFGGTALIFVVLGALMSMPGMFEDIFENPLPVIPFFLALGYAFLSILVARARDLGWPAWIPIVIYGGPWPAYALMIGAAGAFPGYRLYLPENVQIVALTVMFACVAAFWILLPFFAALPGKRGETRWGAPMAGLWGAL